MTADYTYVVAAKITMYTRRRSVKVVLAGLASEVDGGRRRT